MASNPVVRSNSARLAYWFARRSLGWKLVDSSITLNKALHQRNPREFGVSHYALDSKRLFHGTGSTCDIRGVSRNGSASEIEKADGRSVAKDVPPEEAQGIDKAEKNSVKTVDAPFQSEVDLKTEELFSNLDPEVFELYKDLRKLGIRWQKSAELADMMRELVKQNSELMNAKRSHRREEGKSYVRSIFIGICVGLIAASLNRSKDLV